MARVAIVLADDYEDSEFTVPYERVTSAGHDVTIIGKERGATLRGKKGKSTATVDATATEVDAGDFDLLVIPGGYSPDKLRLVDAVVDFTRKFFLSDRPVAAICHAAQLLIEAEVVEGRTLTSWPSVRKDLENAGAEWVDSELVVDGNLITSRKPDDLDVFCGAILERL